MRENFHRDGEVFTAVMGYRNYDEDALLIVQDSVDAEFQLIEGALPTYVVPAPLQGKQQLLTQIARDHQITTFALMSESWSYPAGEEGAQAARDYIDGAGPTPSNHPKRRELLTIFVTCPLVSYTRFMAWEIKRKNRSAPRLKPLFDSAYDAADSVFSFASSWLEECLPAPDDSLHST